MIATWRLLLGAATTGLALSVVGCFLTSQSTTEEFGQGGTTSTVAVTGTGGSGSSVPCSPTLPCEDDNNPCTTEACTNDFCVHTPLNMAMGPESTECVTIACVNGASALPVKHLNAACGMGLKCNADGQCAGCKDKSACPAPPDCQIVSCVATVCQVDPAPAGDPSVKVMDTLNDCRKPVCDGKGGIEFVTDGADLPILDNNPCTDQACVGDAPMYPASAMGALCASASPTAKVCDGNGVCVECTQNNDCTIGSMPSCDISTHTCISCSDGIKDGTETGFDCGGICPKCDGSGCVLGAECKSAICTDNVCCSSVCSGTCFTCGLSGNTGTCDFVPKGLEDFSCVGSKACNGSGVCTTPALSKAGVICSQDTECFTGACNGMCRLPNFTPCSEDAECASLRCVANVCAACSNSIDCASNQCSGGRCKVPGGGVCSVDTDCVGGNCDSTTKLCGKFVGSGCVNDSDCSTHRCSPANTCSACTVATQVADCASDTCDGLGNCLLPDGAFCINNGQCASTVCAGFPAKCE